MNPRQYMGISELLATLVGILNAASQTQNDDILTRLYDLYDTVHGGLKAYVDKEFFVSRNDNIVPLLNRKLNVSLSRKKRDKIFVDKKGEEAQPPDAPKPL